MARIRVLKNTMVIICEDSVLTPSYLGKIREDVMMRGEWTSIDIFPIPLSDVTTVKNDIPDKSLRKKRRFIEETQKIECEIEDKYKAVPVRYVREAQIRIAESGYDEGWAAYDLNGHTKHLEAYELSLNEPIVKLAFTSIAVEHWFLLHFARDKTTYPKASQVPLENYIPGYRKSEARGEEIYRATIQNLDIALENCAWLRTVNTMHKKRCYEINPYIDMDLLVKRLFGISEELLWGFINKPFYIKKLEFLMTKVGEKLDVKISNNSNASILSKQLKFHFLDSKRNKEIIEVSFPMIEPSKNTEFTIDKVNSLVINISFENYRALVEI